MSDTPGTQGEFFDAKALAPDGTIHVNGRCLVRTRDGHRVALRR